MLNNIFRQHSTTQKARIILLEHHRSITQYYHRHPSIHPSIRRRHRHLANDDTSWTRAIQQGKPLNNRRIITLRAKNIYMARVKFAEGWFGSEFGSLGIAVQIRPDEQQQRRRNDSFPIASNRSEWNNKPVAGSSSSNRNPRLGLCSCTQSSSRTDSITLQEWLLVELHTHTQRHNCSQL